MKLASLVAGLVMSCLIAPPARAVPTTYQLAINGTASVRASSPPFDPVVPTILSWTGTVSLTAPAEADGTFTATAFSVDAGHFLFSSANLNGFILPFGGPNFTVADGLVSSVSLSANVPALDPPNRMSFSLAGMTASATLVSATRSGQGPFFSEDDVGVLTNVPEPETYALMLAGLAVLGMARRQRLT
jgi:hypothetical protein